MSVTHRVIGGTRHASVSDHKTYARPVVGMHLASCVHPPRTAAVRAPWLRRATAMKHSCSTPRRACSPHEHRPPLPSRRPSLPQARRQQCSPSGHAWQQAVNGAQRCHAGGEGGPAHDCLCFTAEGAAGSLPLCGCKTSAAFLARTAVGRAQQAAQHACGF